MKWLETRFNLIIHVEFEMKRKFLSSRIAYDGGDGNGGRERSVNSNVTMTLTILYRQ